MSPTGPGRFVVLHHVCPPVYDRPTHYDVMLEHEGALLTWAVSDPPQLGIEQTAERLADHRLAYLEFEGPLTGDRGSVTRWDAGTCRIEHVTADEVLATIEGERLRGRLVARSFGDGWSIMIESCVK